MVIGRNMGQINVTAFFGISPPAQATAANGLGPFNVTVDDEAININFVPDFTANGNTLTYAIAGLPAGGVDDGDGSASGTPTVESSGNVVCTATDEYGRQTTSTAALTTAYRTQATLALQNQSFTDDTGDQTYDIASDVTANGNTLTYSLVSPPSGVTLLGSVITFDTDALASQTGTLITVRATDEYARQVDDTFTLDIIVSATLSVDNISETPVIEFDGLADSTAVTFTIASGYGAGTYTTDTSSTPLTIGALKAAPMNIVLPQITGTEAEGETLTREAGYWLYAGVGSVALTGDWVNDTDGSLADSNFTYLLGALDIGDTISVDETASATLGATFTDVTVSSASTGVIAGSAFDPATLFTGGRGGLWYEMDDTSTIWTDTGRTTNVSTSGDSVAYIDDKSGNGNDFQVIASSVATWEDVGGEQYLDNVSGGFESVQDYGAETVSIFRAWRSSDPTIGLLITDDTGVFISCNDGQGAGAAGGVGTPEYATNGGAVITPTPSRDGLHTAWITGSAVVSEAQNVDFPAAVKPRILDYPIDATSDGAAEIFAEIWVEEPVTAQERADIVAYLQDKYS